MTSKTGNGDGVLCALADQIEALLDGPNPHYRTISLIFAGSLVGGWQAVPVQR